jgi:hypothetical protein
MRPLFLFLSTSLDDAGEGLGTIEALASVQAAQREAAQAEIGTLLQWALAHAPGPKGPPEEGGTWDAHLDCQIEGSWCNLSLSLVGPLPWCETLLQQLGLDD